MCVEGSQPIVHLRGALKRGVFGQKRRSRRLRPPATVGTPIWVLSPLMQPLWCYPYIWYRDTQGLQQHARCAGNTFGVTTNTQRQTFGLLLSCVLNERLRLCYQAPAPQKTAIYPKMKKVTCYPKIDPVTTLDKGIWKMNYHYRYHHHSRRVLSRVGAPGFWTGLVQSVRSDPL